MCNWRKWVWPGLLAIVILTTLAGMYRAENIEQDLVAKAKNELSDQKWAEVDIDGRDLTLKGAAPSQEAIDEAIKVANNIYDMRAVKSETTLQTAISPYKFNITKQDGKLILSGHVPNEEAQASLLEQAKTIAGDADVVDELKVGLGAPEGFMEKAGFAISSLKDLTSGTTQLIDTKYVINGDTDSFEKFEAITKGLNDGLPVGTNMGELAIKSPKPPEPVSPYIFRIGKNDGKLILTGHVPSQEAHTSLLDQAKALSSDAQIIDELTVSPGAPEGFMEKAGFAISSLKELITGSAQLVDTKYVIRGEADSFEKFEAITKGLNDGLPEGTNMGELAINSPKAPEPEPEPVSPYAFRVGKLDGKVTLTGHVPSEEAHAALLDQAKAISGGAEMVVELAVSPGAPEGFMEKAAYAISSLKELTKGSAQLIDTKYTIRGEAESFEKFEAITKGLNDGLPEGTNMAELAITSPKKPEPPLADPYRWSVSKTFAGVVASGHAGSEEEIETIIANVKSKLGTDNVQNKHVLASGAADNFEAARTILLEQMAKLEAGQGNIIGQLVHVAGRAPNAQVKDDIADILANNLPAGFKGSSNVIFIAAIPEPKPESTNCNDALSAAIKTGQVKFALNSSRVETPSLVLDEVVKVMVDCSEQRLQVAGHTDALGTEVVNLQLSESRAGAVRNYLADAGIDRTRIDIIGHGSSQPIASNQLESGRALNRRIELLVSE